MIDFKKFFEQMSFLWARRQTANGLMGLFIAVNSMGLFLFPLLFKLLSFIGLHDKLSNLNYVVYICFPLAAFYNLLTISFWVYWRSIPRFSDNCIGIIFAPHSDKNTSDLIERLFNKFKDEIAKSQIGSNIRYVMLPANYKILNHVDAHKMGIDTNARLIIHGEVQKGKIEGEQVEGFKNISFTIRHREIRPAERHPIMRDLAAFLAFRTFIAKENNSFIEYGIVMENISEVACFFSSVALTLDGQVDVSMPILKKLKMSLEDKTKKCIAPAEVPKYALFKNAVNSCLTVAFTTKFDYEYGNFIIDQIGNPIVNDRANICLNCLHELFLLNRRNSNYYLKLAIIYFHFNKIGESYKAIQNALRLSPNNSPAPYFSLAFLDLWRERYGSAFKNYLTAKRKNVSNQNKLNDILLFLTSVLGNFPDKPQLLFGTAFINDIAFDSICAIKDYKSFLSNIKETPDNFLLRDYAKKRLVELEDIIPEVQTP